MAKLQYLDDYVQINLFDNLNIYIYIYIYIYINIYITKCRQPQENIAERLKKIKLIIIKRILSVINV
jgi:hypothetical protein